MTAVTDRAAEHRIGFARLTSLLAGRAVFRILLYGSTVVLVAAWKESDFDRFAAVIGATNWMGLIIQAGTEKAALKLIPRSQWTRDQIVGMLRSAVLWGAVPFTGTAAIGLLVARGSTATLYLVAIAYYLSLGCGMLGVALHRALGRPSRDTAYFSLLGAGIITSAAAVFVTSVSPVGYQSGLLAIATVLNVFVLRDLPRGRQVRRGLRRLVMGTVVLMGAADVLSAAALGSIFAILALTSHADQSGDLFVVTTGWSFVAALVYTLQRFYQPQLSVRLALGGPGGPAELIPRIAFIVMAGGLLWFVSAAIALLAGVDDAVAGRPLPVLAVFTATWIPLWVLVTFASYIAENTDAVNLWASARGALFGLLAVVAVGVCAIPLAGAMGAIAAIATKDLALALILWRNQCRRSADRPVTGRCSGSRRRGRVSSTLTS